MNRFSYIDDLEKWRSEFEFYINVKIRFSETDMLGHLNNVSSFIYFEEARVEYMKYLGIFSLKKDATVIPVVADLQCDYHTQVFFDDRLKLYIKANTVGNSSIDLHYMAVNQDGIICFTGRGNIVNLNPKTGKPVPLTDDVKEKLLASNKIK